MAMNNTAFKVGQIWRPRVPDDIYLPDNWVIEAITNHPIAPVIARHECGAVRAFGIDGSVDGDWAESGPSNLDLVTLIQDVQP